MPIFKSAPDLEQHYLVDDFTDPWTRPDTILLLHGCAESGLVWYAWMPHLARRFKVVPLATETMPTLTSITGTPIRPSEAPSARVL